MYNIRNFRQILSGFETDMQYIIFRKRNNMFRLTKFKGSFIYYLYK